MLKQDNLIKMYDEAKANWTAKFGTVYGEWVNLYASVRTKAAGVPAWRSNIFIPLVFTYIQEQLPSDCDALFGSGSFYSIKPIKNDTESQEMADAYQTLLANYMEKIGSYLRFYSAVLDAEKFPLGWVEMGWNYKTEKRSYYNIQEGKVVEVADEVVTDEPIITWRPFNSVFPAPNATDRATLSYVANEWTVSRQELEDMKKTKWAHKDVIDKMLMSDQETYTLKGVYTKDEIAWLSDTNDILRQHLTTTKRGTIPFYFVTKIPQTDSIYGVGLVQVLGDLNKWVNLIENLKNDNLMLTVNKVYQKVRSAEEDPTNMSLDPGSILEFASIEEMLKELNMGTVDPKAFAEIERIMAIMNRMVGAASGITTPQDLSTANNQTATGAIILAEEKAGRTSIFAKYNKENFLAPIVRDLLELIQSYAPEAYVKQVLGDKADKFIKEARNKDIDSNYQVIISGDDASYSRSLQLQKIQLGMQLLAQLGPQVAQQIDTALIAKRVVALTGMPKESLKEVEDTPQDAAVSPQEATGDEISPELTPEQVAQASAVLEISPEEVVTMIKDQGVQELVKQVKAKIQAPEATENI